MNNASPLVDAPLGSAKFFLAVAGVIGAAKRCASLVFFVAPAYWLVTMPCSVMRGGADMAGSALVAGAAVICGVLVAMGLSYCAPHLWSFQDRKLLTNRSTSLHNKVERDALRQQFIRSLFIEDHNDQPASLSPRHRQSRSQMLR